MSSSPIEDYLDELIDRLALEPRVMRRVLKETEEHLIESAKELRLSGLADDDAERTAVERFGSPAEVAAHLNSTHNGPWTFPAIAMSLATFFALGLLVVGVSGLLIALFGNSYGYRYVVDPVNPGDYPPSRCADFQSFHPEAADCPTAAMLHHYDELRGYRYDALVLGVLGLAGLWLIRRVVRPLRWLPGMSRPSTWALSSVMFGGAMALFAVLAISDGALSGGNGSGEATANAIASGAAFLACGLALARTTGTRFLRVSR